MTEWIIAILGVLGAIFSIAAGLGLLRLPDVYSRIHATGKSSVVGAVLMISATFIYFSFVRDIYIGKLLLVIGFVLITTPVAALIISRSAYRIKVPLDNSSVCDELKPYYDDLALSSKKEGN